MSIAAEKLAIEGGAPVRPQDDPLPQVFPRAIGPNAELYYRRLIASGNTWNAGFDGAFAKLMGTRYAISLANCTAALHAAVAAVGVGPEDEVVLSPVTDYGSVYGVLAQRAVPVFADVDRLSGNVTARTIEAALTARTRAVICVHWAGITCDMAGIVSLTAARGLPLIEDCCQAPLARYRGRTVGTLGAIGCFSFDNEKHISCGSGGAAITDGEQYYARMLNFAEARGAFVDDPSFGRRHKVLGCNYRFDVVRQPMALAQIEVLPEQVARRRELGALLSRHLAQIDGIRPCPVPQGGDAVYWIYPFLVDIESFSATLDEVARAIAAEGLPGIGPGRYYLVPASHDLLNDLRHTYQDGSGGLAPGGRRDRYHDRVYSAEQTPSAAWYVEHMLRFPFTEKYSERDLDDIACMVAKVAHRFRRREV